MYTMHTMYIYYAFLAKNHLNGNKTRAPRLRELYYYELNKCGKRNIEEKQITENASV